MGNDNINEESRITERFLYALQELKARGLVKSKKDCARILDCSPTLLTEICSGRSRVGVKTILKMHSCFGIRNDWMLHGEGDMFAGEADGNERQEDRADTSNGFPQRLQEIVDTFCEGKNTVCARMTDSNEANIRGYLNGTVPKLPFLAKCSRAFDIEPRWLLTGEGPMRQGGAEQAVTDKQSQVRGIANVIYNGRFYQVEIANITTKEMTVL